MGKVPDWAMPMVVYSMVGTGAIMVAIIEVVYLLGLWTAPHDVTTTAWAAGIFTILAVAGFTQTYRSWLKVKASWARAGVRLCPNCGRLVPVALATCSCGHAFA